MLLKTFLAILVTAKICLADIVYDPTNHAENILILKTNIETLLKETEILKQGITNLLKYEGNFKDVTPFLSKIKAALERGQAISHTLSNTDKSFKNNFNGYKEVEAWGESYDAWSKTTLDTFKNSLKSLSIQSKESLNDSIYIKELEALSSKSEGRDQILQTSNMLSSELNKQMIKLRELLMQQEGSNSVYRAKLENERAAKQAAMAEFFSAGKNINIRSYDNMAAESGFKAKDLFNVR